MWGETHNKTMTRRRTKHESLLLHFHAERFA